MDQSPEINALATALAKAQAVMGGALKDSANPFFKSKYADLESVWTACRKALTDNGLSVVQTMTFLDGAGIAVVTTMLHTSGQWIRSVLPVMAKDLTPQGIGSAITYSRRYALAAIAGVFQTDDDGEAAMARNQHSPQPDTSFVDAARVNKVIAVFDSIKAKDLDEDGECLEIYDMHSELAKEPDLYTAVADALAGSKRIGKADWKKAVARGKELAHRSAA